MEYKQKERIRKVKDSKMRQKEDNNNQIKAYVRKENRKKIVKDFFRLKNNSKLFKEMGIKIDKIIN